MSGPEPGNVSATDREAARRVLREVAGRCRQLGAALAPSGAPVVRTQALMADPERLGALLTSFSSHLAWLPVRQAATPLEALTAQLVRVATSSAGPARKEHELRQLVARIAALDSGAAASHAPPPWLSLSQRQVLAADGRRRQATIPQPLGELAMSRDAITRALRALSSRHLLAVSEPESGTVTRTYSITPAGARALGDPS